MVQGRLTGQLDEEDKWSTITPDSVGEMLSESPAANQLDDAPELLSALFRLLSHFGSHLSRGLCFLFGPRAHVKMAR